MKEIWVLSVRTSLPYECVSKDMLGTDFLHLRISLMHEML